MMTKVMTVTMEEKGRLQEAALKRLDKLGLTGCCSTKEMWLRRRQNSWEDHSTIDKYDSRFCCINASDCLESQVGRDWSR